MSRKYFPILLILLTAAPAVQADGCKFTRTGRFVPEREQRALIEWADGTETLYVAALSDPAAEPTVWVVPVRAPAPTVRAEPVEEFPVVGFYETLTARARRPLDDWLVTTAVLNSGGLLCPVMFRGCDDKKTTGGVREASRVE